MANIHDVDEIQIKGLKRDSMQQFWLFDGLGKNAHIAEEVELLARRCKTVSPNAVKEELYYEKRPHSTAGTPLHSGFQRKKKINARSKILNQPPTTRNLKNESFRKVLQKFQSPKTQDISIAPGYVISKNKYDVVARISTGEIVDKRNYQPSLGNRRRSTLRNENLMDGHVIEELTKKIDDLTAAFEDEKFRHKLEIKQINADHAKELADLNNEHEEHLRAVEMDHAEDLRESEEKHQLHVEALRNEAIQERNELTKELKSARTALETYKENIMKEVNSKWQEHELELELEHGRRIEKLLANQKTELVNDKNKALDAMTKEQRRQIATIVESNKKEMDVLLRKFTATVEEAKKLKEIMSELEQVKSENEEMRIDLEKTHAVNRTTQNHLHDVKVKLNMYKEHFAEKVSEVDEKYAQKINDLMIDNSKIRQQYLKKCDELYRVKSENETKQEDTLITAKDVLQKLILSRTRADVSLTALRDDAADGKTSYKDAQKNGRAKKPNEKEISKRPSSAPSTDRETRQAVRDSAKGMTPDSLDPQKRSTRPASSCHRNAQITPYEGMTPDLLQSLVNGQRRTSTAANTPVIMIDNASEVSLKVRSSPQN